MIHLPFWLLVSGTGRDFSELSLALLEKGFKLSKGYSINMHSCCHPPVRVVVPHSWTSAVAILHMPHLRQKMGCRRGQPRHAPTSSSSNPPSFSSELPVGHRPFTRSRIGRFCATSSRHGPAPTSGSAIFTFDSILNRPRINAYFTVVFHEDSQTKDTGTHPGGSGAILAPSSSLQLNVGNAPR